MNNYNRRQRRFLIQKTKGTSEITGQPIPMSEIIRHTPYLMEMEKMMIFDNQIVPVPASFIERMPFKAVQIFCHVHSIYGIITNELVDYLQSKIKGKIAIEIGCGNGTLGRALNIPITDSMSQHFPDMQEAYSSIGHPTIAYPTDVEKMEAFQAIEKYEPDILIGSYITHYANIHQPEKGGYDYAPNEVELSKKVKKYYMLGNLEVHKHNRLLTNPKVKTKLIRASWCKSRSVHQDKNVLFQWSRK